MKYPEAFEKLIECFESFPGVGPKTAERYAFNLIDKKKKTEMIDFSQAVLDALNLVHECEKCGMITDQNECEICTDESRLNQLMIVTDSKSIIAFEKTGSYKGRYHVLQSLISPIHGVGPDDIDFDKVIKRIKEESINEVVLAIPSNMDGELTALYIKKALSDLDVKVFRIGYGLPVEASVEYADEITLIKSLEGKKEL